MEVTENIKKEKIDEFEVDFKPDGTTSFKPVVTAQNDKGHENKNDNQLGEIIKNITDALFR